MKTHTCISPTLKGLLVLCALILISTNSSTAQRLRSSYFMKDHHFGIKLNPANVPTRGYFAIPVVGSFGLHSSSDIITPRNIYKFYRNNNFFKTDVVFLSSLKELNNTNFSSSTDILSAGWWSGNNFWSFNIGLNTEINSNMSKDVFNFFNDNEQFYKERRRYNYDLSGTNIDAYSHIDIGLGFAREITSGLTIGARVKLLANAVHTRVNFKKAKIDAVIPTQKEIERIKNLSSITRSNYNEIKQLIENIYFDVDMEANIESYTSYIKYNKDERGNIKDISINTDNKVPNEYSAAIDLGINYNITNNLKLSASITDLRIYNKQDNSKIKHKTALYKFNFNAKKYLNQTYLSLDDVNKAVNELESEVKKFNDLIENRSIYNKDLFTTRDTPQAEVSNRGISTNFALGAEYSMFSDVLSVGALYTGRLHDNRNHNEITLSANFRPNSFLNVTASYSMLQSLGKTFGAAIKLGPVFVGADYISLSQDTKHINAVVGVTINLKGKKLK